MAEYEYEIALSFAGEDRAYVEQVAAYLKQHKIKVFYDKYETIDLWGKNLYDHLQDIYKKKSKYVVVFISKHYAEKLWTNHERKSMQARAFEENEEYILPARFDNTEIPGILPTVGYINLNNCSPQEFSALIEAKLGGRKEYWTRQASLAAKYVCEHHHEAHRGAFLWMPSVTAVFKNGRVISDEYIQKLRDAVKAEKILGEGIYWEGHTLVILIESDDVRRFHDLIWKCFEETFPAKDRFETLQDRHQKKEALTRLYSYFNKPVRGDD